MIGSVSQFEEPWPSEETRMVADAIRAAVAVPRRPDDAGATGRSPRGGGRSPVAGDDFGGAGSALTEAGRRWALAHQSASLMRSRLEALEASLDIGPEADRAAYHRAWRIVTDAATWTSLNLLEEAAMLDPLTGVGNRRALDKLLTGAVSGARRLGSQLTVVALDVNGLKQINDSRGHPEGDKALIALVVGIGTALRASDAIFRTGGDEFALVLPGIEMADVASLMRRIARSGIPAFTWGAATLDDAHQTPSDLLDGADADLYRRRSMERALAGGSAFGVAAAGVVKVLRHPIRHPAAIRPATILPATLPATTPAARPSTKLPATLPATIPARATPLPARATTLPARAAMERMSRRASVAVAAVMIGIAGALAAVHGLSPASHPGSALGPLRPSYSVPPPAGRSSRRPAASSPGTMSGTPSGSPATTSSPPGASSRTSGSPAANAAHGQVATLVTSSGVDDTAGAGAMTGTPVGAGGGTNPPASDTAGSSGGPSSTGSSPAPTGSPAPAPAPTGTKSTPAPAPAATGTKSTPAPAPAPASTRPSAGSKAAIKSAPKGSTSSSPHVRTAAKGPSAKSPSAPRG